MASAPALGLARARNQTTAAKADAPDTVRMAGGKKGGWPRTACSSVLETAGVAALRRWPTAWARTRISNPPLSCPSRCRWLGLLRSQATVAARSATSADHIRAARSLATDGVAIAARAAARAATSAAERARAAGKPEVLPGGWLLTATGRAVGKEDQAEARVAKTSRLVSASRMVSASLASRREAELEQALSNAHAAISELRIKDNLSRRKIAFLQEKEQRTEALKRAVARLEAASERKSEELVTLKEELAAMRRNALSVSVQQSQADVARMARRLESAETHAASLQASEQKLSMIAARQKRTIAELEIRLAKLVEAAKVVGNTQAVAAARDPDLETTVKYEAVAAELDAVTQELDYVPHSRAKRQQARAEARRRAEELLERARSVGGVHVLQSGPATRGRERLLQSPVKKRQRRAQAIRDALHAEPTSPAERDETELPAILPSSTAAATTRSLPEIPIPVDTVQKESESGLGMSTAEAFAAVATERLPIMDGWLAQSMATKMEQSRTLEKQISSLKAQLAAKRREVERLRTDRQAQDHVLNFFLQQHNVKDASEAVAVIVDAIKAHSQECEASSPGGDSRRRTMSTGTVARALQRAVAPYSPARTPDARSSVGSHNARSGRPGSPTWAFQSRRTSFATSPTSAGKRESPTPVRVGSRRRSVGRPVPRGFDSPLW